MTPVQNILSLLIAERDRLNRAIEVLQGSAPAKRRGRPPKNPASNVPEWVTGKTAESDGRKTRTWSAAQKKAAADRMRARWAAKKAPRKATKKKAE